MDGVLLLVVIGDGKLVVPVDFAVRRPNPQELGRRCRTTLVGTQGMLDEHIAALCRRGLELPAPLVVADSRCSDSKLMAHVADTHQGTLLLQGKATYTFYLKDGCKVKGTERLDEAQDWPFRQSLHAPTCRYARLRATSPTYGEGTVLIVEKPGAKRFYLLGFATPLQATHLLRLWMRRHWIEQVFWTLKHL
jgi:hypothetical protein